MQINQHARKSAVAVMVVGCLAFLSASPTDAQKSMSTEQAAIEKAVRKLDAEWSAAALAKNVDKTVSYYAADALVLPPNAPAATTSEAIRAQWKKDIETMISGSWKATRVEVAKSGDMANVSGTYKDANGKTIKDRGKYLEVFEKQADGSWKCGADCWNSDLPATP
jgi:ketosteroid isomerase-like protein